MSIFKIKEWWSTANKEYVKEQNQSDFLICIDKLWNEDDGDSIIYGDSDRNLRIYKPQGEYNACDLKLEVVVDDDILQITAGKYVTSTDRIQILILHPRSIIVYEIQSRDGHTNIGDQNALTPVLQHNFEKYAYNLICGKFGGVKNRDLICVQSLDGTLNFYDQETRLFNCHLHETIIPGPLAYAKSPDLFVTVNCNWILEIYSYQQLQDAGDTSMRYGGKKLIPEWIYNPGEEIFTLQVIQTSNNMSNIICLGERHIYCLQDNGLLRFMKKFDYTPVCFTAYLIGWYYEPGARLILMVASDDSKIYIYENTTLLWSCDSLCQPIFISRSYFKGLSAGIVTLSTNGDINCCYLGTVPDLKSVPTLQSHQSMDVSSAQTELNELEAKINNNSQSAAIANVENKLQIEMEMRELKLNDHNTSEYGNDSAYEAICSAVVKIKPHPSANIVSLQVTLTCDHPFECSEKCRAYETLEDEKVLQVQIYIKKGIPILNNDLTTILTFVDNSDKISAAVIKKMCRIPLFYYFRPATPSKEAKLKLTIQFDSQVGLPELFQDFNQEELSAKNCNDHTIAIKPIFDDMASEITITRAKSSQRLRIQSQNYFNMHLIIRYILNQFHEQYAHTKDIMHCNLVNPILSEFYQIFYTCIENHSQERLKLENLEDELSTLQKQFALIQKLLLLKYGTLPPGDCDALAYLLKDTQTRLLVVARNVMKSQETLSRSGYELASAGGLVVIILQLAGVPAETISVLKQTLALHTLYADYKEWQETVSQCVTHILNTVYGCTNKEKEKIAALTEESILKKNNLKRFMKQLQMLFDKAVTGIQIDISEAPS